MSTDTDDDIRADFLAESGELLAGLGQQLVELERTPADGGLLNAVFRGFHTIKGGAGFLGLEAMVALCHIAEEVFNALRKGERKMDAALMDAALESLECLQGMHAAAAAGRTPAAAPAGLLERLRRAAQEPAASAPLPAAEPNSITDDEFEALLDQIHGVRQGPGATPLSAPPVPLVEAAPARQAAPPVETSVRVDIAALDGMMNLVGELVLVRNRLKRLCSRSDQGPEARAVAELDHITRSLQTAVMRVRMQPIRRVFSRFPRLAREVARGLGKQVEVELVGEDTGLDKSLVEAIADPLVHMVRNSVDHGIELPEARLAAGKPATGRLRLTAQQAGDQILITVEDDGAGMDPERLRAKAVEKGLLSAAEAARLTQQECLHLVFLPGFSTRERVSELSGRGVGMDVVKSSITALGGAVQIESRPGFGSSVRLRVPLTLAILPALMVGVGKRILALPLAPVLDVFALDPAQLRRLERWDVILHRKDTLRLIHLHRWLDQPQVEGEPRHVVIAQVEHERYGFVVSQVHAREEVVIKPLGAMLRGLAGVAGATVTGSGRVALILDLPGLARAGPGPNAGPSADME